VEKTKHLKSDPVYTLSIATRLSGIPDHSIRQYIDKGLLVPYKTATGRHLFSDVDISRLKCIRKMIHENGLNIAGIKAMYSLIPCWEIKSCTESDRSTCDAFTSSTYPCWEASNKGVACRNEDCRLCVVYRCPEKCRDFKSLIKSYMHNQ